MRKDTSGASHGMGVSLEVRSSGNNYKVRINHAGLQLNLGRFADAHTARLAFDQAAVRLRGPDAGTNYPVGSFPLDNPKVEKKLQQFLRSLGGERHQAGADAQTDSGSGKTGSDDQGLGDEQLQEAAVLLEAAAIARSASADGLAAWMEGQPATSQQHDLQAQELLWGPAASQPAPTAGAPLGLTAAAAEAGGAECAEDISHLLSWAHLQDFQQDDTELQQILAAGLEPVPSQAFAQDESPFSLAVSVAEAAADGSEGVQLPPLPPQQLPLQQQQLVWQGPPVPLTLQRQPTLLSSSSGGSQSDSGPSSQHGSQLHQHHDQQHQAAVTSVMRSLSGAWGQQPSQQPAPLPPPPPAASAALQARPAAMPDTACLLMPASSHGSTYTFGELPPATGSGGLLYGSLSLPPATLPMAGSMPGAWYSSGFPPAALLPTVGSTGSAYTSTASLLQTTGSTGSTYTSTAPVRPQPPVVVAGGGGSSWGGSQAPPAAAAGWGAVPPAGWPGSLAGAAAGPSRIVPAILAVSSCSQAALGLRGHLLTSTNPDALAAISLWYTQFEHAGGQSGAVRRVLGRVAEALANAPTGGVASATSPIARADALQLLEAVARAFGSLHQQLLMVAQSQQAPASTTAAAAAVVQQWLSMLSLPGSGAAAPGRPSWLQAAVIMVAYQLKSEVTAALQAL